MTGSGDRTIKFWDLASGQLKLTLTGHIEQVTGVAISPRHPYMFSCALDKMVKCWDLEYNKVRGNIKEDCIGAGEQASNHRLPMCGRSSGTTMGI